MGATGLIHKAGGSGGGMGRGTLLLLAAALLCYLWASSSSAQQQRRVTSASASSVYLPTTAGLNGGAAAAAAAAAAAEPGLPWCTPAEAEKQAAKFAAALKKEGLYTACPSHAWLAKLPGLVAPGQGVVALDVGCNKGYESAALLAAFAPRAGVSPARVYEALSAVKDDLKLGPIEGQCSDHKSGGGGNGGNRGGGNGAAGSVTVHCFEPSSRNYRGLQALHAEFFGKGDGGGSTGGDDSDDGGSGSGGNGGGGSAHVEWRQYNTAVTNVTGKVKFPSECNTELCSLGGDAGDPSQKGAWTHVAATTLDDFAAGRDGGGLLAPPSSSAAAAASAAAGAGAAGRFVVLKIDTEGYDPAVLQGARRLLAARVPAIVSFEHHGKGAWATTSLRAVAMDLASVGYVCYFDGQPTLTRVTGCWHDSLELKAWSNVVCAPTGTRQLAMLESLSWLAAGRKG